MSVGPHVIRGMPVQHSHMEAHMTRSAIALFTVAMLFLSACGTGPGERGATGAGIGAGAGAIVGAVTGLSVLQGALIGAAVGGLTGALTGKDIIDLGDPVWATVNQPANKAAVSRVQAGLTELGYNPGAIDGVPGSETTRAIQAYQRDHGLLMRGQASYELARHIDGQLQRARGKVTFLPTEYTEIVRETQPLMQPE